MHLKIKIKEKFKLKTKLIEAKIKRSILCKLCRIVSAFIRHLNFQNPSTGSGDITSGSKDLFHFAFKEKHTKNGGEVCLVMIDNLGNYLEQLRIMLPHLKSSVKGQHLSCRGLS